LVVSGALAPETRAQTGDPEAGARASDAMCDNCHGPDAEGGFGPDLAGGLTLDQFRRAIRRP
jgi:mono/diheme cytochrome c family protein